MCIRDRSVGRRFEPDGAHHAFVLVRGLGSAFTPYRTVPERRAMWQNTDGLLRQYFPKCTDLSVHSPARLLEVATELNARPRKTLGGITPAKAMQRLLFDL